jgi:hypothetical protein
MFTTSPYGSYGGYYGPSFVEQLLTTWTPWLPIVGVWMGGLLLALVLMPLSQRSSALTIVGIVVLFAELVVGVGTWFVFTFLMNDLFYRYGISVQSDAYTLVWAGAALLRASIRAVGLGLLFAAVLQGRMKWPEFPEA